PAVLIVARELGIEENAVHAVDIYFDDDDAYSGFDVQSPLAVSGGKLEVVKSLFKNARRPIMLVGDGATDLEAKPAVDLFVGFAGVVARQQVIEAADVVINERSLAPVIELALGPN
ncbi:MAG TPA: hypothetical protein VM100_13700, partial [Longimicrobiales bacterium]|nr:hypothetical protein [Longimicrobiales bacterium]